MVLSGSGNPEAVPGPGDAIGVMLQLYSISTAVVIKSVKETKKKNMADPSI